MPQSLACILVHLVFSTKDRRSLITDAVRPQLHAYITNQPEHHRRVTFQEEYRMFLKKYAVEYDERYVWD